MSQNTEERRIKEAYVTWPLAVQFAGTTVSGALSKLFQQRGHRRSITVAPR
jgi:hypothetical protein